MYIERQPNPSGASLSKAYRTLETSPRHITHYQDDLEFVPNTQSGITIDIRALQQRSFTDIS